MAYHLQVIFFLLFAAILASGISHFILVIPFNLSAIHELIIPQICICLSRLPPTPNSPKFQSINQFPSILLSLSLITPPLLITTKTLRKQSLKMCIKSYSLYRCNHSVLKSTTACSQYNKNLKLCLGRVTNEEEKARDICKECYKEEVKFRVIKW